MGHTVRVAAVALNQWALDYSGNAARIRASIRACKEAGVRLRTGPELEITGYACNDHFLEGDTCLHAWEVLCELLVDAHADGMLVDVGMPVVHRGVLYNCRVFFFNRRIVLIRPKMALAGDGNYREPRWFTAWTRARQTDEFVLPRSVAAVTNQTTVPFGDALIALRDTVVGCESCEELFAPRAPHIDMGLDGCEIFVNGSASHHEFRKLHTRIDLLRGATAKTKGIYLYSNQKGCDGERLYYDGCALIAVNGDVVAQGAQFSLADMEVVVATVDLEDVRAARTAMYSRGVQAASSAPAPSLYPRVHVDLALSEPWSTAIPRGVRLSAPHPPAYLAPEDEIRLGPACWLWDYLRRSRAGGFFLPLSGGIDSCATALIVYSMCQLVVEAVTKEDLLVLSDVRAAVSDAEYTPRDPRELCGRLLHTAYMGTSHSSSETRRRARELAQAMGADHLEVDVDSAFGEAMRAVTAALAIPDARFSVHGGSNEENTALQNVQARMRMLLGYTIAQLLPRARAPRLAENASSSAIVPLRHVLVLGSANVDECLMGYFTKYDCSSADLNPIGGIAKHDLRRFVSAAADRWGMQGVLDGFLLATPTAELEPLDPATGAAQQSDERDMGLTYRELEVLGGLRKTGKCGPWSMFTRLLMAPAPTAPSSSSSPPSSSTAISEFAELDARTIADKVVRFFTRYAINRHKMTTLTPAYHMSSYGVDDNRFDLRPFLYETQWTWATRKIWAAVAELERADRV